MQNGLLSHSQKGPQLKSQTQMPMFMQLPPNLFPYGSYPSHPYFHMAPQWLGMGVNPYVLPVHCHSYSVVSDLTCVWCRINPLNNSWLQQITPIYLNGFTIVTAISIDEVTTWACTFQSSAIRATRKLIRSHRQQLSSSQIGSGLGRGLQTFWSHMQRRMWGWWVKEGFWWQQLQETMEGMKQTSTLALRLIMITIGSIPTSFNDLGPNTYLHSTMMGFLAINW